MFINKQKRSLPPKPAWSGISVCRFGSENSRNSYISSKSVGSFLPQLTRKAFEKFGFSTASLILDWPKIAGSDLAACTRPEEVKWPKNLQEGPVSSQSHTSAALLVLRVDPAHCLEISYKVRQIMERINRFFGYRAISDIRLFSAPLNTANGPVTNQPSRATSQENTGKNILTLEDPLQRALARLKVKLETAFQTK